MTTSLFRHDSNMLNSVYGTDELEPYWVADMDFEVAPAITQAIKNLAERGRFAYEFNHQQVFQAISHWYQKQHKLTLNTQNFAQVPGVLTGIALLIRELTQPGDGILIQTPVYHQFKKVIASAGRHVIRSPLVIEQGQYQMDFEALATQFATGKVKMMLLCNPHNPVGRVWNYDKLEQLLALATVHNVFIVSDEIHSDIVYPGHTFHSLAGFNSDNVASLLGSPAKTFGMQSIANGYIYTNNSQLLTGLKSTLDAMYLEHGNTLSNYATIAAYEHGTGWLQELLEYLQQTLQWIETFIQHNLPGVTMYPVEGTYQIWLDFNATGSDPEHIKQALIKAGMALTPGSWFESDNELFFRMNIASPRHKIQHNFNQLKHTL